MARKDTIPDYDRILTLAQAAEKANCSDTKIRKAVRYGHLAALQRASQKQPLRFRLTEVTRWLQDGASAKRPRGFTPAPAPAHLERYWRERTSS
ncbi:helix-turn-helix domain-containing protein [Aeromicrobium alkaliterrae]|uniref:Helix-turn-helix domain-containing protein n=1 Tax=Aeromicrobium alkaliterrae TaxID=302168 RepID=A0ABP4VWH6_9ACTN